MSSFIIVSILMLLAAIAVVGYPLLRTAPSTVKGEPALPRSLGAAVVVGALLVIGSVAMYRHASNFPWQDPSLAQAAPAGHGDMSGQSMENIVQQLEARLAANPNDAEGWRMLARTYVVTERPQQAVAAYEKILAIVGDKDPALNTDLAEALILTDEPAAITRAASLIDAALAANPANQKALWYSGVMAYKANDMVKAKERWTALLAQNPPDEIRQIIEQQLAALGGESAGMGAAGAAAATPAAGEAAAAGRTIRVSVSLDPSLKDKAAPGTAVFVAAREPGIPGPPLAATRLTVDELPTTVVLSDAGAMIEGRNLSSVNDVEVVARVAFGGTPMAASGDLIGSAIQKKGGPSEVAVAITKVQP